jgi:hypothetical protein
VDEFAAYVFGDAGEIEQTIELLPRLADAGQPKCSA